MQNSITPQNSKLLAKQILADVEAFAKHNYDDGHRSHLGASLIGRDCDRYLWYVFRWCLKEAFDGRMQRLFQRGHREEAMFIELLEGIGCQVWFENRNVEPNEKGEYPQYRISDVMGHFGGSLDAIIKLPERYGIEEVILGEFKTSGSNPFGKLTKDGMAIAKPEHFCQTSTYGLKFSFNWVLYMNVNKNDDTLHVELVKLSHDTGKQMISKAERIITSQKPPARLSDNPTFHKCGYCAMKDMCHRGAVPEVNCRSCTHAVPVENAQWQCTLHNGIIPKDFILQACGDYKAITQNV